LRSRQTLGLVWRSSRSGTLAIGVLTVLAASLPPMIAYVGKLIVDAVVAHDRDRAVQMVLAELAVVATLALLERALGLARQLVGARLGIDVNVAILKKAETLELQHFEDSEFYDKLSRARREASLRPLSLIESNFQVLRGVLTLTGYIVLLLRFSPSMVLGLLAATVPAFIAEA
jgi:ATP-binding cassette subfamily B protein